MGVIFWVLAFIFGIAGIVGFGIWMESTEERRDKRSSIFAIVCVVSMTFSIIIATYFVKVETVTKMVAFQMANRQAYQYTIDETENLITVYASETEKAKLIEGSIEKFKVATEVSLRLKELRDDVTQYNKDLAYLERMNSIPIVSIAYPGIGDLKYIILE